jgi:outer membrane protein
MGSYLKAVLVVLSAIFFLTGPACAEPQKERRILTLQELIEMATAKSPDLATTRSEVASARQDLEQVKAAHYPQVETLSLIGPVDNAKRPEVRGARIIDPSAGGIGVFGRMDFTLAQPLYTFGKLSNREEAAGRGVRAVELKLEEKRNEITFRIKQLYYAYIVARAGLDVAKDADGFFDDAGKRISRLLQLGSSNVMEEDLYRVDAYRADSLRLRAEAEKGARVSYFALKSLIGFPPEEEFDIAERALPTRGEDLAEQQSYIQKALTGRPELKQLEEALAAQDSQVRAAQSDRYPSFFVALFGSLAGAPGRETLHNSYIPDVFNHAYAGIVTGINWHFDFGISGAKVDKQRAEYEKLVHTKASGRQQIPIQVANTYQQIKEWKAAMESYHQAALASRKWLVSALTSFDMGVGTADDMLRAIEKYGQNQGKYLEAVFNYNVSSAELDYVSGARAY